MFFAAVTALLAGCLASEASSQSNARTTENTNQAAASPSPEPTQINSSAVVSEAETAAAKLRAIRSAIVERPDVTGIENQLPQMQQTLDAEEPETLRALSGNPSLDDIRAFDSQWRAITRRLGGWAAAVQESAAVIEKNISELTQMSQLWRSSIEALQLGGEEAASGADASSADVPPEILQIANEILASIDETRRQAQERRTALLGIQTRVSELESRSRHVRDEIRAARGRTLTNLFVRDEPPIWARQGPSITAAYLWGQTTDSISTQAAELRAYSAEHVERFALHGAVFVLLAALLYWARRRVDPFVRKEPKLEKAAQIFSLPIATSLILTVLLSGWFYPQAPRLLSSLIGAAAIVPVVLLLRRMVDKPIFVILNALVILYFVDRFRDLLVNQPLTGRIVFLAEMLGAILFLVWFLKSRRLSDKVEAAHYRIFKSIKCVVPFALAVFVFAFVANALGFVSLSYVIGNGVLNSAYLALVLYTAVQIIRGLIIFALRVRPLAGTRIVKHNRPLIRARSERVVRWIAAIIWVLVTLSFFSIRDPIISFFRGVLAWSATLGSIDFSLGSIVLFVVMIWVAVLISRFLRFILQEEVYPRVDLGGGVSYAVSTMLHYSILVVGFVIAVGVLGVDFTKFALIAGAVGIGIGFGLQNIINNFVSGLILLFERPVKVGDMVQLDQHTGILQQIGLRASVLRKVDGSDAIVPNSFLISEAVINWTMSDKQRRIDIPVGVAYGTDPELVSSLLLGIASAQPSVLTEPAPKALLLAFGDNSLDFELRAWTDDPDGWVLLRSQLMSAIYTALTEANIEIPFPQRDLHLRTVDKDAAVDLSDAAIRNQT